MSWHRDDFVVPGFGFGAAQLGGRDVSIAVSFPLVEYGVSVI